MIKKIYLKLKFKFSNTKQIAELYRKQGVRMGENCNIFKGCSFGSEPFLVKLGNNVKITNGCKFITHDGGVEVLRNLNEKYSKFDIFGEIILGDNVFVGNNCIFLPNSGVGDNVVIGAGSLVTKNFPSNVVIGGVPAKIIKTIDEYLESALKKSVETKKMNSKEKLNFLKKKYNIK